MNQVTETELKQDLFVSVIIILNDVVISKNVLETVHSELDNNYNDYELILVNNGFDERYQTAVNDILSKRPRIRCINLSYGVHDDVAIAAGVENAIGDFVVLFSEAEPVSLIKSAVNACANGSDIIIGTANQKTSIAYKFVRPFITYLLKNIGYRLPKNATQFRCISRRTVNSVTAYGRFYQQFYVRISNTGYPSQEMDYVIEDQSQQKKNLFSGFYNTVRIMVFNSTRPLRWMSGIGFMGSSMAFLFALYSLVLRFFKHDVIEGWTSLVLIFSSMFMLLFTMLAFFGEYLSRLLDDRSEHRDYDVVSEQISSIQADVDRINVESESI